MRRTTYLYVVADNLCNRMSLSNSAPNARFALFLFSPTEKLMLGMMPSVSITKDNSLVIPYDVPGVPLIPPVITRTAATPIATPQSSPGVEVANSLDNRRNLNVVTAGESAWVSVAVKKSWI